MQPLVTLVPRGSIAMHLTLLIGTKAVHKATPVPQELVSIGNRVQLENMVAESVSGIRSNAKVVYADHIAVEQV